MIDNKYIKVLIVQRLYLKCVFETDMWLEAVATAQTATLKFESFQINSLNIASEQLIFSIQAA